MIWGLSLLMRTVFIVSGKNGGFGSGGQGVGIVGGGGGTVGRPPQLPIPALSWLAAAGLEMLACGPSQPKSGHSYWVKTA